MRLKLNFGTDIKTFEFPFIIKSDRSGWSWSFKDFLKIEVARD